MLLGEPATLLSALTVGTRKPTCEILALRRRRTPLWRVCALGSRDAHAQIVAPTGAASGYLLAIHQQRVRSALCAQAPGQNAIASHEICAISPALVRSAKIGRVRRANVLNVVCAYDETDPDGFRSGLADISRTVGGEALAVKVYELPSGESICPYHYEYEEEWLLILNGTVVIRTPEGEEELARGEMVRFPPGPAGAHKAINRGDAVARIVMFSNAREPAVAVYPDSNKIGVWPGNPDDKVMLRRADGNVDYWAGEH